MTKPPMPPPERKPVAARRPAGKPSSAAAPRGTGSASGVVDQVRSMAGKLLDVSSAAAVAGRTLDAASKVSRALWDGQAIEAAAEVLRVVLPSAAESAAWTKTGAAIRAMRESAGLTIAEVGAAIDLKDPSLIEALENGRVALSFELILRLAAVFGRKDPIGFVMSLTRTANPELWKSLEALGVGKLVLQSVREHQFVNVYRSNDAARGLSDEEFAEILSFTQVAFEMAMAQRERYRGRRNRTAAGKQG
ncbi:MAG: helix-turn-helix transcriptional regulator [Candidatus Accumulibacter sp.]|uniref:helix-turn-helix domain-containing protein n=1 Tax=Accumulibacter sp. TaxID=2053492 RepID=UPI0019F5C4E8|nr:helix-turn-helix transcriptional regulator [Accumulibacter sp.]MBE2259068.1 helix-turn-helix transcriptional regulator [Paracoccaceae bacterium]MCB1943448.1 helix-turn-helix transcriptional regulator [Accumulibacter sp.]MCP5248384.1 helix-turn-helix transcriptional regulator [Accumulibacter sp.]